MPKANKSKRGRGKGIYIDQTGLAMFARYLQEQAKPASARKINAELAEEFGVPERTFTRKIEAAQRGMDELSSIASKNQKVVEKPKERDKTPGPLSQGVIRQGKKTSPGTALVVQGDRGGYMSIKTPTKSSLEGLSEEQTSYAGVAMGIVFGDAVGEIGKALSENDRPLGERAFRMARGSSALGCSILGFFESLRRAGLIGDGLPRVIDGTIIEDDTHAGR